MQNLLSGASRSLVDLLAFHAMSRIAREARLAALAEQCRNWVVFRVSRAKTGRLADAENLATF